MTRRIDRTALTLGSAGALAAAGVLIPDIGLAAAVVLLGVLVGSLIVDRALPIPAESER